MKLGFQNFVQKKNNTDEIQHVSPSSNTQLTLPTLFEKRAISVKHAYTEPQAPTQHLANHKQLHSTSGVLVQA